MSYPNPTLNGQASLYFEVDGEGEAGAVDPTARVTLRVFTQSGVKVWETHLTGVRAGGNSYRWNGLDLKNAPLANGLYFYSASVEGAGGTISTKTAPMLILR